MWLRSSSGLEKSILYIETAEHSIAHKDIDNIEYVVEEIQTAN